MAPAAACSKEVVLLLLVHSVVFVGPCFVIHYLVSFLLLQIIALMKRESWLLYLNPYKPSVQMWDIDKQSRHRSDAA